MNDFTKEELKCIYVSLSLHALEGWANIPVELVEKIQSMIDNYCEHESSEPKLVLIKHCVKCNQHLETRQWGLHDYK